MKNLLSAARPRIAAFCVFCIVNPIVSPILRLALSFLLLWPAFRAAAQPAEVTGPDLQQVSPRSLQRAESGIRSGKRTLNLSAAAPFFDDFSTGRQPDSNRWDLSGGRFPQLSRRAAMRTPSLGAATFDGTGADNQPYETFLARGAGERLESHYIDLAGFDAASRLMLSFFLEPRGLGHAPSSRDSFRVFFNARFPQSGNPDSTRLVKVFAVSGQTPAHFFTQYTLPITDSRFFHERFYLVFEHEGLLNGYLSRWHLDYVMLAPGRQARDTLYGDRSITLLDRPAMSPYTALPLNHYRPGQFMQSHSARVHNLSGNPSTVQVTSSLTDAKGNNVFNPPYQAQLSQTLPARAMAQLNFNAFADNQALAPRAALFRHELRLSGPPDLQPDNDRVVEYYRLDSLMAYDDGETDAGYGLNRARGFGQEFVIAQPDTLEAIWICFAPTLDYLRAETMEGKSFRLTVWNGARPDSVLVQQDAAGGVQYGDSLNHFMRYALDQPKVASGRIWAGITQYSDVPIGAGLDYSYNNMGRVRWDSAGRWITSRIPATLMIRLEFRTQRQPAASAEPLAEVSAPLLYPQPLRDGIVRVKGLAQSGIQRWEATLFSASGSASGRLKAEGESAWRLPPALPAGLYLLQLEGWSGDALRQRHALRLWVE